jgi:hypothetical protein
MALSRAKLDPATRAYLQRKHTEGKTKLEAIRCLKRQLARRIYHLLYTPQPSRLPYRTLARKKPELPNFT